MPKRAYMLCLLYVMLVLMPGAAYYALRLINKYKA